MRITGTEGLLRKPLCCWFRLCRSSWGAFYAVVGSDGGIGAVSFRQRFLSIPCSPFGVACAASFLRFITLAAR
jgi:hypothetical protein